jgi:outer membrane protein W
LVCALLFLSAVPAAAQVRAPSRQPPRQPYPSVSPRGFVMFGQQQFTAKQTFEAVFGKSVQPLLGGGVDVVLARHVFVEFGFSRFEKTGERVFRSGTETFHLGIPLTAKITPFEIAGGYRLTEWRLVIPYGGAGFGTYKYEETSDFADTTENLDVSKRGFILLGGAEVRLMRWAGVSIDVRRTKIDDVLGAGGISKEFGENDLGGTSFRVRIMVGR